MSNNDNNNNSAYDVLGTVLSPSQKLIHLFLTTNPQDYYYFYEHFRDVKAEAQRGCPK